MLPGVTQVHGIMKDRDEHLLSKQLTPGWDLQRPGDARV